MRNMSSMVLTSSVSDREPQETITDPLGPGEVGPGEVGPGDAVLETRGLAKRYGKVEALRALDLRVERGEVYGFLGRNGAGKSTTIRIIMGITRPTEGSYRLFGRPGGSIALTQRIGYVAQEQNFYGWMTPTSLGRFVRGFYPTWDDGAYQGLVRQLDLPSNRKIRTFSGGMQVKLALALALAHHPDLLVLDEPTAGLDPVARREFLEMVRDQAERSGRTTFFSTHLIDEIELAAHRVGIVDAGRTRYEGSTEDLAARVKLLRCALRADGSMPPLTDALEDPANGFQILQDRVRSGARCVVVENEDPSRFALLPHPPWVGLEGLLVTDEWILEDMPLEEIFIEMVRRPL